MPHAPRLTQDGFTFRDLNKNGRLDPYEDCRLPVEERIADLLAQMVLPEKAGLMFHNMIGMNQDGTLVEGQGFFGPVSNEDRTCPVKCLNMRSGELTQMAGQKNIESQSSILRSSLERHGYPSGRFRAPAARLRG